MTYAPLTRAKPTPLPVAVHSGRARGLPRPRAVQAKLVISSPRDAEERQADAIAQRVMQESAAPPLQGGCTCEAEGPGGCGACGGAKRADATVSLASATGSSASNGPASPSQWVAEAVAPVLRESGEPLPAAERRFMEDRMGRSFKDVRLHRGSAAAGATESLAARAFTAGHHIAFAPHENIHTRAGRHLLAHELVHVEQQEHGAHSEVHRADSPLGVCSKSMESKIAGALTKAQKMLDKAAAVRATDKASAVEKTTFGEGFDRAKLDTIFESINATVGGWSPKTPQCNPDPKTYDCGVDAKFAGFDPLSRSLFLCPPFFASKFTTTNRALNLIHEAAHDSPDVGIGFDVYSYSRLARELPKISPAKAIRNPDTLAQYVFRLAEPGAAKSFSGEALQQPKKDTFAKGFATTEQGFLLTSLAWAEAKVKVGLEALDLLDTSLHGPQRQKVVLLVLQQPSLRDELGLDLTASSALSADGKDALVELYNRLVGVSKVLGKAVKFFPAKTPSAAITYAKKGLTIDTQDLATMIADGWSSFKFGTAIVDAFVNQEFYFGTEFGATARALDILLTSDTKGRQSLAPQVVK